MSSNGFEFVPAELYARVNQIATNEASMVLKAYAHDIAEAQGMLAVKSGHISRMVST